jgi:hypothetical protein
LARLQRIAGLKKAAGEIKLTEYTNDESQAARARIEEQRAIRRDQYLRNSQ